MAKDNAEEWKDWIGELFTPSYDVTTEDMLGQTEDVPSSIKSKVKLVSALDPDTVKDVFERVRTTCVIAEEMKKKKETQIQQKDNRREEKGLLSFLF